ncbi:glycosyltransferase [Aliarcobacter butzleri]|uniref:glycosyltransferase n=1 Tax=Aliarcobacter butzleri TaxID=28197 RepID=UPI0021B17048|nr:glycosyltransferase [Aliarcobacter butzleri]MCT7601146.1 glycosyltransferase [Aliarcobacter butzleri]MCT7606779.1 glycosyltransferase [Aliarcobacter butzleri]MCT7608372.1 glycosyltransferase [Aliarcobacter butzleri]MCT7639705.1 glycosyltransferase [Aliarcobacter butzleri]MDK2047760.1 glycosyltransferase [Aliarcobacter butzleri]
MEKYPKCSIIISVYKDTDSLDLILESLCNQTIIPDEIIISEDGNSVEMSDYVKVAKEKYKKLDINHLFQEDIGWRKNIALNRAIVASKYEYLIFIDGDCVPFDDFIENHLGQATKRIVLAGKRVELGENITREIRSKKLTVSKLTNNYWLYVIKLINDKTRHLEDILHISYKSFLSPYIKKEVNYIIGCNWSAFKEDILEINGFDETYTLPSVGEDVDLGWRFRGLGIELKSCRYNANLVHLYHKKRFDSSQGIINNAILKKNFDANKFFCDNGIKKKDIC